MLADSSSDVLYEHLRQELAEAWQNAAEEPDDNGRRFAWDMAAAGCAGLIAYRNTRERRYLDLVGDVFDRVLAERDSEIGRVDELRGRVMHGWGGTRYQRDGRYSTNVTLAGRVAFILLSYAQAVRDDAGLPDAYHERAEQFVRAAKESIDEYESEFRVAEDEDEGYYWRPGRDDAEPLNHMAWAGNALILLFELTGEEKYARMARRMANWFRNSMWVDERDAFVWCYMPQPGDRRGPDPEYVWKARTTVHFMLFAREHGVVFTSRDVERLCNTFMTRIRRGDGRFSIWIDRDFADMNEWARFRGGYLSLTSWILFDAHRPGIRDVIEEMVASRPDAGGWLRGTHAVIAYAHRLKPSDW